MNSIARTVCRRSILPIFRTETIPRRIRRIVFAFYLQGPGPITPPSAVYTVPNVGNHSKLLFEKTDAHTHFYFN